MYQKVLLCVDDRPESAKAVTEALRLARTCDARIFAAWVLPATGHEARVAGATAPVRTRRRAGIRKTEPGAEGEEHAWSRLYEIEDEAFEQNVRISLLLETGDRDEKLLALIDSYQLDALMVGTRSIAGWEKLIERSPVAVILIR
jgi:nucleotide-binding universal stress UspA family protein